MNNLIDLDKFLAELEDERKKIEIKLDEINKQIHAVEIIKNSGLKTDITKRTEPMISEYQEIVNYVRKQRRRNKLTQVEAIKKIAKRTENDLKHFKLNIVKNIMVEAGFFKTPSNASSILYTVMERSGQFEKIEPGLYKVSEKENS